jgi:hypothetical protein
MHPYALTLGKTSCVRHRIPQIQCQPSWDGCPKGLLMRRETDVGYRYGWGEGSHVCLMFFPPSFSLHGKSGASEHDISIVLEG